MAVIKISIPIKIAIIGTEILKKTAKTKARTNKKITFLIMVTKLKPSPSSSPFLAKPDNVDCSENGLGIVYF